MKVCRSERTRDVYARRVTSMNSRHRRRVANDWLIAVASVFVSFCPSGDPSARDAADTREAHFDIGRESEISNRVDSLLSEMTLDEKIGQLGQYGADAADGDDADKIRRLIEQGQVGAILGPVSAKDTNSYQHVAVESSRLHVPILFGLDVIHGFRTTFPIPLALASSWDPQLVEEVSRTAAREASAAGIRWTFSPMVDIARDPRWGRIAEGAGEDPYLGSQMAAAYVHGYQGQRLVDPDSIAACAKHFVGYGAAEGGRDYNTTDISEHTLREIYFPPFKAAVDAGAATIMSAFNSLNGVPASANTFLLSQVLRTEWKFRGFVDSDDFAISELVEHGVATNPAEAARKAFLAGVDMDMRSDSYHDNLARLVERGEISPARVDDSVRRILRLKFELGLFARPYVDESRETGAMLRPEAVKLAHDAAEESFVLLRNAPFGNKPILPLTNNRSKVALIGPLSDDAVDMLGAWADFKQVENVVTLRAALFERIGPNRLTYIPGIGIEDNPADRGAGIESAVEAARTADVVILALGERAGMSGEAASRAHLTLPGQQEELLEKVSATGKPIVLIIFGGRPLTLPWAFENVPAVLAAWAPGIQAGPALVDTLFGDSNPSGRLVISWPRFVGQEPMYYNSLSTGRPFGVMGQEVFSPRYIDEPKTPQFPFGFGLSYTNFNYGPTVINTPRLRASSLNSDLNAKRFSVVTATSTVTNTGPRAGQAVAQLYVRLVGTSTSLPVRELKGFQKISLAPGEAKKVVFELPAEAFAHWGIRNQYAVEAANATVWIGSDSQSGTPAELKINE